MSKLIFRNKRKKSDIKEQEDQCDYDDKHSTKMNDASGSLNLRELINS